MLGLLIPHHGVIVALRGQLRDNFLLINLQIEMLEPDGEAGLHLGLVQHRQHEVVMLEHFIFGQVRDVETIVARGVLVVTTPPLH